MAGASELLAKGYSRYSINSMNCVENDQVLIRPFVSRTLPSISKPLNGESHAPFSSAALICCAVAGVNYNSDVHHLSALGEHR